jgi:hypothetical protein
MAGSQERFPNSAPTGLIWDPICSERSYDIEVNLQDFGGESPSVMRGETQCLNGANVTEWTEQAQAELWFRLLKS